MIIRKAEKKDCERIAKITETPELRDAEGNSIPADYFSTDIKKDELFFVAEESNEILGFLLGIPEKGRVANLSMLGVTKESRGKGVGKALMQKFKNKCQEMKITYIYFYAPSFNENTLEFYKKQGCLVSNKKYQVCSLELS